MLDALKKLGINTERLETGRKPAARTPDMKVYNPEDKLEVKVYNPKPKTKKQTTDDMKRGLVNEKVKQITNDASDIGTALYGKLFETDKPNVEDRPINYQEGFDPKIEPQKIDQDKGGLWALISDKLALDPSPTTPDKKVEESVIEDVATPEPTSSGGSDFLDSLADAAPYLAGPLTSLIAGEGLGLGAKAMSDAMKREMDRENEFNKLAINREPTSKGGIQELVDNKSGRKVFVKKDLAPALTQSGEFSIPENVDKKKMLTKSNMVTIAPKGEENNVESHITTTYDDAYKRLSSGEFTPVASKSETNKNTKLMPNMYNVKTGEFGTYGYDESSKNPTQYLKASRYRNEAGVDVIGIGNKEIPISVAYSSKLRGDAKKYAETLLKEAPKKIADLEDTVFNVNQLIDALNGNTPIGEVIAIMNLAKSAQGGGRLSDRDVAIFGGSKAWDAMIDRFIKNAQEGKMDAKSKLYMYHAIGKLASGAKKEMNKRLSRSANAYEKLGRVKKGTYKNIINEYTKGFSINPFDVSTLTINHPKFLGGKDFQLSKIPAKELDAFLNDLFRSGVGPKFKVRQRGE